MRVEIFSSGRYTVDGKNAGEGRCDGMHMRVVEKKNCPEQVNSKSMYRYIANNGICIKLYRDDGATRELAWIGKNSG